MSDQDPFDRQTPFDATIMVGAEAVRVRYRPRFGEDPDYQAALASLDTAARSGEAEDPARLYCRVAVHIIEAWDVVSDGVPAPVTEENLYRLPLDVLRAIIRGIGEHAERLAETAPMRIAPEHVPPPIEPGKN